MMGQNGAGKSTIFKMLLGELKPQEGSVHIRQGATIGIARQVMSRDFLDDTVREYFAGPSARTCRTTSTAASSPSSRRSTSWRRSTRSSGAFSGQQARLLWPTPSSASRTSCSSTRPPITSTGRIDHLTGFLMMYPKTVLVISHDADFLNAFTEGVHLDVFTGKVEAYVGNYFNVVEEIAARLERERITERAAFEGYPGPQDQLLREQGRKMRKLASKLRDQVAEAGRRWSTCARDDKTISDFKIPHQDLVEALMTVTSIPLRKVGDRAAPV